jgi:NADPH:quinone reductase-like Zn-dependent oxidoreductase
MDAARKSRRWGWKRIIALVVLLLPLIGFTLLWLDEPEPLKNAKSGQKMLAVVYHEYGGPEVLKLESTDRLLPNETQVLIQVRAAAANALDWHVMRGSPYLMRLDAGLRAPHDPRMGVDVSGVVVAVGNKVTRFKPGDEVFGVAPGAFAEYALASEGRLVTKPANLSFEQAAAIPVAAMTALQGLRDEAKVQPGQKVLINGASGGVGTFAVQIAKALGADVTGVCSARNVELVRSLGADRVIDYKREDFTRGTERYDVVLDVVGIHSLNAMRGVLKPTGVLVLVGGGGPDAGNWIGALGRPVKAFFLSPFVDQQMSFFISNVNPEDLGVVTALIEAGKVRAVLDRTYALAETAEAIRYMETGRARAKVIIAVANGN